MNLNMFLPKNKKNYYFQPLKSVKPSLNKLIENQKKHWNIKIPNERKNFTQTTNIVRRVLDDGFSKTTSI